MQFVNSVRGCGVAVATVVLVACGSPLDDAEPRPEVAVIPAPPPEVPVLDGSELGAMAPRTVATVTTEDDVRVDFHEVYVDDEDGVAEDGEVVPQMTPSIIIAEFGHEGGPSAVAEVHASVDQALTSAELWIGLTGTPDALPTELAVHHEREAWILGRSDMAYLSARRIPLEAIVAPRNKGISRSPQADLWDDTATFLQPVGGHLHTQVHIGDDQFTGALPTPNPYYVYACTGRTSERAVFKGKLPGLGNNCQATISEGWVRTGIANVIEHSLPFGIPRDFKVEPYYGPSQGAWIGLASFMLKDGDWTVWGWNLPIKKGLSLANSRSPMAEPYVRIYTGKMIQN